MRFLDMWNPFTLVGYEVASDARVNEALRELFSIRPHLITGIGMGLAALSTGLAGSVTASLVAMSIGLTGLLVRALVEWRSKSVQPTGSHRDLIRLFVFGSSVSALTWSLCAGLLFYQGPPAARMLVIGVSCAFVQGAAGRAYMMPGMAMINNAALIGMVCLAGAAQGNLLLLPAGLAYFCFLTGFINRMISNRLDQLDAEQTADKLFNEIVEKNELLRIANESLARKAYEDPLTGLANRRKFDLALEASLANAGRNGDAVSLLMIDVDHFKSFNDTYGHQAGDECLQVLSRVIAESVSMPAGLVARYGGEEFVVVLPATDAAQAQVIAERIRIEVRLTDLRRLPNTPAHQTVSIGLATCGIGSTTSREDMVAAADAALYEAKKQGRNRVCVDTAPGAASLLAS